MRSAATTGCSCSHTRTTDHPALRSRSSVSLSERPVLDQLLGEVFRRSFDEVLDGQRTGRFLVEDLAKTEKTYLGTALDLEHGPSLDFVIAGQKVDCKFSLGGYAWMIPIEARDRLCLLLTADDASSLW